MTGHEATAEILNRVNPLTVIITERDNISVCIQKERSHFTRRFVTVYKI